MRKLYMMSAPSASGKSTKSKEMMEQDGNLVRINRDDIRAMSILKWTPSREGWIIAAEIAMVKAAAAEKKNIIVDDTNLSTSDEDRWSNLAKELDYEFHKITLQVDLETCVERDLKRIGSKKIGRAAIERQFLRAKLWKVPEGKKTVIFDIDGTLADLTHRVPWITIGGICPNCVNWPESMRSEIKCKFCDSGKITKKNHDKFYETVILDPPIEIVVKWIKACYGDFHVLVVSGRAPEKCADSTVEWLKLNNIQYDHLIMRRANCHGPDDVEKQMILDDILKVIPKEDIAFVVDDRPNVVAMWRKNGILVIPVRGRDDDAFYMDK